MRASSQLGKRYDRSTGCVSTCRFLTEPPALGEARVPSWTCRCRRPKSSNEPNPIFLTFHRLDAGGGAASGKAPVTRTGEVLMYVFCVGMYRSCSTWQYNIVCRLVERHRLGHRL